MNLPTAGLKNLKKTALETASNVFDGNLSWTA